MILVGRVFFIKKVPGAAETILRFVRSLRIRITFRTCIQCGMNS